MEDRQHDSDTTGWEPAMTDLMTALIDQGLTRGLLAMQYTHGLTIAPVKYDVAAVAACRLLDTLPGHVTVAEVLTGLNRRAVTLGQSDDREVM